MTEGTKIRGYVTYVFFPKTGLDKDKLIQFVGFVLKTEKYGKVACYGKVTHLELSEYVELEGDFEDSSQSKFQFKSCVRVDDDDMGAYSMLLWLFGAKTGQAVVEHGFNNNAMEALETFKEHKDRFIYKVSNIKGLGEKRIEKAYEKYEDHVGIDVIFSKYMEYGMHLNDAMRVYSKLGNRAIVAIKENPYILYLECGLRFELADKIALAKYNFLPTDERRIYAGSSHALRKAQGAGHCYIRLKTPTKKRSGVLDLKSEIRMLLNINEARLIDEQLEKLFFEKKLVAAKHRLKDIVCTPEMNDAEFGVADQIVSRLRTTPFPEKEINSFIQDFEKHNFELDGLQKDAIRTSVQNQFSLVSGPPGAGKTTIINTIVKMLQTFRPKDKLVMCSPTGKAAQRMKESTGIQAYTIHRLLEYNPQIKDFSRNENNPLDCDIIVVDEFSMCGILLFYKLLLALPKNCHIILVGDHEQLPSIEPGKVLEDLLSLDFIPKTILTKVYRQKDGSAILTDALAIGKEDLDAISNFSDAEDLKFHEQSKVLTLRQEVVDYFLSAVKKYGINNVCILSPMNKDDLGTMAFNRLIQDEIHPFTDEYSQITVGRSQCFRMHDRVIQIKNEPDYGVFNGDVGTIVSIEKGDKALGTRDTICVDFGDGNIISYQRDRFDKLRLAYCLTVHKSQGSEYKNVILILHSTQKFMLKKKLVYTGWTRAKERLDIFGEKKLIKDSISNKEIRRNSRLRKFLMDLRASQ